MNRGLLVLVVAALCGLGTIYGIQKFMTQSTEDPNDPTVEYVVAVSPIMAGSYLSEPDKEGKPVLGLMKNKMSQVHPNALVRGQADLDKLLEDKRWAAVNIEAKDTILGSKLGKAGTTPGLLSKITPGKRGVSIAVTTEGSVGGFIMPENHVDIVAHFPDRTAKVLMQDVRVIAVGDRLAPDPENPSMNYTNMTFDIKPEEAFRLRDISGKGGQLSMMLRGNDSSMIPDDQLTWKPDDLAAAPLIDTFAADAARAETERQLAALRDEVQKAKDEAEAAKTAKARSDQLALQHAESAKEAHEALAKLKGRGKGVLVITDKVYRTVAGEAGTNISRPNPAPASGNAGPGGAATPGGADPGMLPESAPRIEGPVNAPTAGAGAAITS